MARAKWIMVSAMVIATLGCSGNTGDNNGADTDASGQNGSDNEGSGGNGSDDGINDGNNSTSSDGDDSTYVVVGRFPGGGDSGSADPLVPGIGPETADECGSGTPADASSVTVIDKDLECFYSEDDSDMPAAYIEQIVEVVSEEEWVHLRLTLDPRFVDNTYGDTAIGWDADEETETSTDPGPGPGPGPGPKKGGHTFDDLVGSDHAEIQMFDKDGNLVLQFKIDYISEDSNSESGYGTLGVNGGEGKMIVGDASSVLGAATSLDRNLNGCGLGEYTENSPATDENYSLPEGAEAWDYRVVYEVWVDASVFGDSGFGKALIENVHASPSKAESNTVTVTPGDCPCDSTVEECDPWDPPDTDEVDTAKNDSDDGDTSDHDGDTSDGDTSEHDTSDEDTGVVV